MVGLLDPPKGIRDARSRRFRCLARVTESWSDLDGIQLCLLGCRPAIRIPGYLDVGHFRSRYPGEERLVGQELRQQVAPERDHEIKVWTL